MDCFHLLHSYLNSYPLLDFISQGYCRKLRCKIPAACGIQHDLTLGSPGSLGSPANWSQFVPGPLLQGSAWHGKMLQRTDQESHAIAPCRLPKQAIPIKLLSRSIKSSNPRKHANTRKKNMRTRPGSLAAFFRHPKPLGRHAGSNA